MENPIDNKPLKDFYEDIKGTVDVPDYATFEATLKDEAARKTFYEDIKGVVDVPDYNTFNVTLFGGAEPPKKKEATTLPGKLSQAISNAATQKASGVELPSESTSSDISGIKSGRDILQETGNQFKPTRNIIQEDPYWSSPLQKKVKLSPIAKTITSAYKDYKVADENLRSLQRDLDEFLLAPKGEVLQTDVHGKPTIIQGGFAEQQKKDLEQKVFEAKIIKNEAANKLGEFVPSFKKTKEVEIGEKLKGQPFTEMGGEKFAIPEAVKKVEFIQDISDLEDTLQKNGKTLEDFSTFVDNNAPKEFLDKGQQELYEAYKTGDPYTIETVKEKYYKDIYNQTRDIDDEITRLSISPSDFTSDGVLKEERIKELNAKKKDLLLKTKQFLKPDLLIQQAGEVDPDIEAIVKSFGGISNYQKVKLIFDKYYYDFTVEKAKTSGMENREMFGTGFKPIVEKAELRKIEEVLMILAPVVYLNEAPKVEQSKWTRIGKGYWNNLAGNIYDVRLPLKEDIASKTVSLLGDVGATANISKEGKTILKKAIPDLGDQAIDIVNYVGAIMPYYAATGGAISGLGVPEALTLGFNRIGRFAPIVNRITPQLVRMTTEGLTSKATGELMGGNVKEDLTFWGRFAGQGFTEGLESSVYGKFVSKLVGRLGIKNTPEFVKTLAKIHNAGTGEAVGESVEELITDYQRSKNWDEFKQYINHYVDNPSQGLLFVLGSYLMGGMMGGVSPNISKKVYEAGTKKYENLSPEDKQVADKVMKDVEEKQMDGVVDLATKTADKMPEADLTKTVTELNEAEDKLSQTEVTEGGYSVKAGEFTFEGKTPEDLQNDIDDVQTLNAIYTGEQEKRSQEGIVIEQQTQKGIQQPTGKEASFDAEKINTVKELFGKNELPRLDIKIEKEGYVGSALDGYTFLAEGSEHAVYVSEDKSHVIKIGEPYSSNETFLPRVTDAITINNLIGDGSLDVIGTYESKNGTLNPVYMQNYVEGKPATNTQIEAYLQKKGFEKTGADTYTIEKGGKTIEVSDTSDNFIVKPNGGIVAIDAAISIAESKKNAKVTETKAEKQPLTETIYNNFVETGEVPKGVLLDIAEKVKNKTDLTVEETAVFNDKTSEVNEILKNEQGSTTSESKVAIEANVGESQSDGGKQAFEEGEIRSDEELEAIEKAYEEEAKKLGKGQEYPNLSYKEQIIHQNIGKVDEAQLREAVGEKVFTDDKMALRFTKKGAQGIDQRAQELSEQFGVEITPQDIVDYFVDRTKSKGKYLKQKIGVYKGAVAVEAKKANLLKSGLETAIESTTDTDLLMNPDYIESLREFPLSGEEVDAIKDYLSKIQNDEKATEQFKAELQTMVGASILAPQGITGKRKPITGKAFSSNTATQREGLRELPKEVKETVQKINQAINKDTVAKLDSALDEKAEVLRSKYGLVKIC